MLKKIWDTRYTVFHVITEKYMWTFTSKWGGVLSSSLRVKFGYYNAALELPQTKLIIPMEKYYKGKMDKHLQ